MPHTNTRHMKKYFYSIILLFYSFIAISQNKSNLDYENWIVDLSQAQSSFEGIKIDKIELNDRFTVVHMSFQNNFLGTQHIEACNTFHIRSNGKKVARFVKAENIPTRYIEKTGFSCADETSAMRIKRGQFVRFRIFFTRIPQYLNNIDVIEYNGRASCEFDVWNLNIGKKEPLPQPSVASTMPKTKTAPTKPVNKKTIQPPVKKKDTDAIIASKSATPLSSAKPQNTAEVHSESATTLPEKREVQVVKEYVMNRKTLQLEIWDNDQVDGDVVSIMLNNRWILRGIKVTKTKKKLEIPLAEGNNTLVLHADNLGTAPPNTAAVSFWDSEGLQTIILNSDMDNSQAIRFIKR